MSRFFFVAFSDSGHLNPLVAVAQHLEAAGHEVELFSSQADLGERLARAGLRAHCHGGDLEAGVTLGAVEFSQQMSNPRWARRWLKQTLVDRVPSLVGPLRELLRRSKPDVVACDSMAYAGVIAAELEGLRWAGLSTGFFALIPPAWTTPVHDVFAWLDGARAQLFEQHGVRARFRTSDAISPRLNVVFTSEALVSRALAGNDDVRYVGPARPLGPRGDERAFPWERVPDDRPLVYVAFGSHLSHSPAVYETLFSALSPDEAFFMTALKSLQLPSLPPHVLAVEYAPQLELLRRASVMVHHGGANSVMECLGAGCPMLVVPIVYEQPVIGRLVEASGAGAMIEAPALDVASARRALLAMLPKGSSARMHARRIQSTLEDGGAGAARLLVELAAS